MNYFIFAYLVCTVLSLNILLRSVWAEEMPNLNKTLNTLKMFCKSTANDEQTKNHSDLNINKILHFDYHEYCCAEKIVNLTGLDSCILDTNDVYLYIKYPKAITRVNTNQTLRHNQQKHKCLRATTQSFCESVFSTNLGTNKQKLLHIREDKSSNEWLDHHNNKIRRNESNSKTAIPLKLIISDITWPSMASETCANSDKALENSKEKSANRILILLAESAPVITSSPQDIYLETFEQEKLVLKCIIHGFPSPHIEWLRNNSTISQTKYTSNITLIQSDLYHITIQFDRVCTTITTLKVFNNNSYIFANYSCLATNGLGKSSKTFLVDEDLLNILRMRRKIKPFNVTGFIIGMMPPILISFYIIMKLGYRSRYAQERIDEHGMNEEPFFVSY